MRINGTTIVALVLGLGIGWWAATSPASPVNPEPVPGRPVVSALVRLTRTAARLGLWFALAAEPPPEVRDERIVQHVYDAEGHQVVDHAEGW